MHADSSSPLTIAEFIIDRLYRHGVRHVFSLPGTSCAGLLEAILASERIKNVPVSSELEAGYAADAYARLRGLGALSVAYGVGTLSLLSAVAGSYVERVPVVVINGGPSARELWEERNRGVLFSHSTGLPRSDLQTFRQFTVQAIRIETPDEVHRLDAAIIQCKAQSRPVYLEIPNDLWRERCPRNPVTRVHDDADVDGDRRAELHAGRTFHAITMVENPIILAGAQLERFGLLKPFKDLLEASGLPYATTLLGKSLLPEDHPQFVGVYDSDLAPGTAEQQVHNADMILALGTILGVDQRALVEASFDKMIVTTVDYCRFGYHQSPPVPLDTYLSSLTRLFDGLRKNTASQRKYEVGQAATSYAARRGLVKNLPETNQRESAITYDTFFTQLDHFINKDCIVLVDTCLASFPGADLYIAGKSKYIAQPVWLSIGYLGGAMLGARCAARKKSRVIGVIGDGGFQATAQGYSSLVRIGGAAALFVLNNGLYGIEQFLINKGYYTSQTEPLPYCRLQPWNYCSLAVAFGGQGLQARTNEELQDIFATLSNIDEPVLVEVYIEPHDLPRENRSVIGIP